MIFRHFPLIKYDGYLTRDITVHARLLDDLEKTPGVYLPYTLKEGETAEDISFHYYGSVDFTPYILMANKVVNPFIDWYMTDRTLAEYIKKKYHKSSREEGDAIIYWALDETIFENIVYFESLSDEDVVSVDTAINLVIPLGSQGPYFRKEPNLAPFALPGYRPIRVHEYESRINDMKKTIRLIDKDLIHEVAANFIKQVKL